MLTGTLKPVSNQETWTDLIEFIDDETGEPAFTESDEATWPDEITLKVRDTANCSAILSGSLTGGALVIVADGVAQFTFSKLAMSSVCPKTYEVGVLYSQEDETHQIVLGSLPVLKGL